MRDIRFRAWDIKNKRMRSVMRIDWTATMLLRVNATENPDNWEPLIGSQYHEFELMQFTGLKDKNGTEIYEGDIVIWEDKNLEVKIGGYMGVRGGESYNEAGYGIYGTDEEEQNVVGIGCFDQDESVKVIGNIYENPELLGKDGE